MKNIASFKLLKFSVLAYIIMLLPLSGNSQKNNDFEIAKNLDIYTTLYKELDINYVDDIEPGTLMQSGIEAMLGSLDPYTNFIPESDVEDYTFITTGQYGGIGALIHREGDYVIISEPYKNSPADKAGLKAGDKILEINDKSAKGKSTDDVSEILKGQPGTPIKILLERQGISQPMKIDVTREEITVPNIPYYGMLKDGVGYIKLVGFTQNASKEVKKALTELKEKNELKGLILDLRGNGGGLLQEAVNITNLFVEKGEHVVSTKGRLPDRNKMYATMTQPVDINLPLVVLVNGASASASEIVAGAIQDLDRGIIIGQRTFGKGLVQNVLPLPYNNKIKITVAKYYIPSGRCIQAIDYSKRDMNGEAEKTPDSLFSAFKTHNGRTVYDRGGIEPDIPLEPVKFSNIAFSLFSKYLIFNYATKFYWSHSSIPEPEQFIINDSIYNEFLTFISDKDYSYPTESEQKLKEMESASMKDGFYNDVKDIIISLRNKIEQEKMDDLQEYSKELRSLLKGEIVVRYYYDEGRIITTLSEDPEIERAIGVLNDQNAYRAVLDGSLKSEPDKKTKG
ncbi:MAG: S41 family peptidase [Bacteroidetes bacterium]|nr:S41 family peptidase [Bacteroidota bacterium]